MCNEEEFRDIATGLKDKLSVILSERESVTGSVSITRSEVSRQPSQTSELFGSTGDNTRAKCSDESSALKTLSDGKSLSRSRGKKKRMLKDVEANKKKDKDNVESRNGGCCGGEG